MNPRRRLSFVKSTIQDEKQDGSDASIASWSLRFCLELEDVITMLSGMSTLDQIKENIKTSKQSLPLSDTERTALGRAMEIYQRVRR